MVLANDFFVIAVRAVAFTPNVAEFDATRTLATVLGRFPNRYDGDTHAIPLPEVAPTNINRILLSSQDSVWKFGAAPARVESTWSLAGDERIDLRDRAVSCSEVLERFIDECDVRCDRLGLVIRRLCYAENPAQQLIDRFCNDSVKDAESRAAPFRNSKDFQIHNHKQYPSPIAELSINSWVRCKTGIGGRENEERPIVYVDQDINTLAEQAEHREFTPESTRHFFEMAAAEADDILQIYFPN